MSIFWLLANDIIGSMFLLLDMIADIAFLVHLQRHFLHILFPVALTLFIMATLVVNVLAGIGIEELATEMSEPEMRNLELGWLTRRGTSTRVVYAILGTFGFLPHVLVGINFWIFYQDNKNGNENTRMRLKALFEKNSASYAVKEIQSVLESGVMIYLKCYYIFLSALLYTNNWPLILGLSFNVCSLFFGLRRDMTSVTKWRILALLFAFVNLSLRLIIILVLARATRNWVFFIPIGFSIALLLTWGTWLSLDAPVCPSKFNEMAKNSKPKSVTENCMSSIMYTLFLVPDDFHTAISIVSFAAASIAISCVGGTHIVLRILMPFAGTVGQLPARFWWNLFKFENESPDEFS